MDKSIIGEQHGEGLTRLTAEVVAAYVRNNVTPPHQIADLIHAVFSSLTKLNTVEAQTLAEPARPAVPIKKSIMPDYLICLEDGKKLKMLKRYLRSTFQLTPEEYRAKWGLPPDYPMVAPNYAAQRSAFAKEIGLGRGAGRGPRRRSATKAK